MKQEPTDPHVPNPALTVRNGLLRDLYRTTGGGPDARKGEVVLSRLESGGSYQCGDRILMFTENGGGRVVEVNMLPQNEANPIMVEAVDYQTAEPSGPPLPIAKKELDAFCRGERLTMTACLKEIRRVLFFTTVYEGGDYVKAQTAWLRTPEPRPTTQQFFEACEQAGIPIPPRSRVIEQLTQGIKHFYYTDPPAYQELLDSLLAIAKFQGEKLPDTITILDSSGTKHAVTADAFSSIIERKYGSRQKTTQYTIEKLIHLIAHETGGANFQLSSEALDE